LDYVVIIHYQYPFLHPIHQIPVLEFIDLVLMHHPVSVVEAFLRRMLP
jgi:hypothetical protein